MQKRAELSLNVIVMATIAVLVLVVLSYIFINGAQTGNRGLLSCESKQGTCQAATCNGETQITASWQCDKKTYGEDAKCCIDKDAAFGFG